VQCLKIRTADGLLEEVKLLSVGHVAFAYQTIDGKRIGLALSSPADASGYRWTEKLAKPVIRGVREAIQKVESGEHGFADVPMDVTERLHVDAFHNSESLMERLASGGPVMFPLAAVAILALAIIIERAYKLYITNADRTSLVKRVLSLCREKKYEEAEHHLQSSTSVVPRTLAACLRSRRRGPQAMEDSIHEQLLHELPRLRRFLGGLAILAGVAPLLGLLGTVTGIIETFSVIRAFGSANPGLMAGGISKALVTTATGLIIAIPILLLRGMLRGRMARIIGDAESHTATLLNMLSRDR
jgi:biopolymer transport protein ExbB